MNVRQASKLAAVCAMALVSAAPSAARAEDARSEALQILRQATAALEGDFASPRMEAMRNLMGAAQAVYIAPQLKQAGLIVGGTTGRGILLRRHGRDWSDPVFLEAKSVTVGFQGGAAELQFVAVILTDAGADALIAGDSRMSSGGGATLGPLGVGGGGTGGISGGVESITFAFSRGVYFGGNVGTTSLTLLDDLNEALYGRDFSQRAVLARPGGALAEAVSIRKILGDALRKSWGE